jgi:membrane-bound lytic murein transglycosylase F
VRPSRRVFVLAAGLAVVAALAFTLDRFLSAVPPLPSPEKGNELVVLVLPGPVLYFPGPDGATIGFNADLIRLYAATKRLPLRFVTANSPLELLEAIGKGQAHVGIGGLLRPVAPRGEPGLGPSAVPDHPRASADALQWTTGYLTVEPVLICNSDGFRPANWNELDGETVAYMDGAGLDPEIAALRLAHPGIKWQPASYPSPAGLIAQVSDGALGYALVGSLPAAIARNIYLNFDVAFRAGPKREMAWAVPARFAALREDLDRFLLRARHDGTLARLSERYMPERPKFGRIDASALKERMEVLLPQLRPMFHDAQEKTGIEWRLLAALAFQESKWDATATSETGVRGMMQITEDTARHLGISDLADPRQNIVGAARYLARLKAKLPARIAEPDRTWFALAAYNIGLGHVEDARILAQKQRLDPNHWSDVKKVLPLLALPEYYGEAKLGYARGGMPVAFVDRVRGYYDLLLAHESPHQPRLRLFADSLDRALGTGAGAGQASR